MENFGIGSWLQRRRPKSGGKTALIAGDRILSYEQFADRSCRLANALRDRGVARGDRVAYLGRTTRPSWRRSLPAASLGAIFVPLNTRLAPPEIRFQLQDCGAVALIYARDLGGVAQAAAAGTALTQLIAVGDGRAPGDGATAGGKASAEDYEDVVASGSSGPVDEPVTPGRRRHDPLHLRNHRQPQGRTAHAREHHLELHQRHHRFRLLLHRRGADDLPDVPCGITGHGGSAHAAQGWRR